MVNLWMDRRFLPRALRLPGWLWLLNLVSGFIFLGLGVKGYWDHKSRPYAVGSLCAMLGVAVLAAYLAGRWTTPAKE